jgi:membrane-associated phospholipid phosphatase
MAVLVVIPLGFLAQSGWEPLITADVAISEELVVSGRGSDVDFLRFVTAAGSSAFRVVLLVPLAAWLAWRRQWRLVVAVVAGGALIGGVNEQLKVIFDRPRPFYEGAIGASGFSYPSGHAAGIAAMATVFVVVFWPLLSRSGRQLVVVLAIGIVAGVGYTRVALGVHFTSDVIAGWCVGVAWVLLLAVGLRVFPGQPGALPARGG